MFLERRNAQGISSLSPNPPAYILGHRLPGRLGAGTRSAYRLLREHVAVLDDDRILYKDMERVYQLVEGGRLLRRLEEENIRVE